MTCKVKISSAACLLTGAMAFGGYNDLGPYSNSEYNEFWDLRQHAAVDVSSASGACSSETFDSRSFVRVYAGGCDVRFGKPGLTIVFR